MANRPASDRLGSVPQDVFLRLQRAREFMYDCYPQPLELEEMARVACMSPFHFLRMFQQAFGETPYRYLTRRRIDRARELLSLTSRSVTDVCFDVGYQSLGSFSTLFRRVTGNSPLSYRTRIVTPRRLVIPCCFTRMWGYRIPIVRE